MLISFIKNRGYNKMELKLYVEKYDKHEKVALFDFVNEHDFLLFKYNGDVTENIQMDSNESSMLLIRNLYSNVLHKSEIFSINLNSLLKLKEFENTSNNYTSAVVYSDYNLPNNYSLHFKKVDRHYNEFYHIDSSTLWNGPPCSLASANIEKVIVHNVGQGNWNSIESNNSITHFDIGASIYKSNIELRSLLDSYGGLVNEKIKASLIISHWDIDHYNLLKVATDKELKNLCCVYIPNVCVSLTSKNIANRLLKHCKYVVAIPPSTKRKRKRTISLQEIYSDSNYKMFTGEKSSSTNKSGLALAVWGNKSIVLLTADHSNKQVFDDMYFSIPIDEQNKQIYLVVPHHGGNAGSFTNMISVQHPKKAIVSTGKNNYGHPLNQARIFYTKLGFEWIRTDYEKSDIIITLT